VKDQSVSLNFQNGWRPPPAENSVGKNGDKTLALLQPQDLGHLSDQGCAMSDDEARSCYGGRGDIERSAA
jgi:hypothetical protein